MVTPDPIDRILEAPDNIETLLGIINDTAPMTEEQRETCNTIRAQQEAAVQPDFCGWTSTPCPGCGNPIIVTPQHDIHTKCPECFRRVAMEEHFAADLSRPTPKQPGDRMAASYAEAHGLRPRYRRLLGRLYWRVT